MAATHPYRSRPFKSGVLLVLAMVLVWAAQQSAWAQAAAPIDGDLAKPAGVQPPTPTPASNSPAAAMPAPGTPATSTPATSTPASSNTSAVPGPSIDIGAPVNDPIAADAPTHGSTTYQKDDLVGAAEGLFGKGAAGLAGIIQDLLDKQGEPNGYIVGREGGGAFIFGLRYGSGTLHHKIEGTRPVYWTGPSVGIDAGANAASTFVLVYNLFDTEDLFKRFGAGEGQAYLVGGFHVSYLRRGDVVLIPVRSGAGLRLGINAGYMKFSKKQNWLPF